MNNILHLNAESFHRLLAWLDPDVEQAGQKYEDIRRKLIRIFASRGSWAAEELADETIDRVGKKVADLAADYVGDPSLYFFGVANRVFLEWRRKSTTLPLAPPPLPDFAEQKEREDQCLSRCMANLPPPQRHLLLDYYREEKQAKINRRKALAVELDLTDNALKIKVFRLRVTLQECLLHCLTHTAE